jgi:hypothetical protein
MAAREDVVEFLQQLLAGEARGVRGGQPGEEPALVPLVVQEDFLIGLG